LGGECLLCHKEVKVLTQLQIGRFTLKWFDSRYREQNMNARFSKDTTRLFLLLKVSIRRSLPVVDARYKNWTIKTPDDMRTYLVEPTEPITRKQWQHLQTMTLHRRMHSKQRLLLLVRRQQS
jgi:hypothetical protein